jgi:hypothetical protein
VYEFCLVGAIDRCPEYGVPTAALLDEARAAGWRVDLAATFDTLADLDPTLRSAMSADAPLTPVERDVVGVYVACILSRGAALDPQECAEHDDQGPGRHQPGNQKQGWTEDAFHLTTGGARGGGHQHAPRLVHSARKKMCLSQSPRCLSQSPPLPRFT